MLMPDRYFPCLADLEKQAVRLVYDSFVPTYFVVPCEPIDDLYAGSIENFPLRQPTFENMFRVTRVNVVIFPGTDPIECYSGFYEYYLTWLLYDPIAFDTTPPICFQNAYSNV